MKSSIKKEDLSREIFDLFDSYVHNKIDRREFIEQVSTFAVGGLTVSGIIDFLFPNYIDFLQIKADDPRLKSEFVEYNAPKGAGKMNGLLTRLKDIQEKRPGIIVVHENRGLNPHIEDVARRVGLAGFLAFAPDALYPLGGYPGNDDDGRVLQKQRDKNLMLEDFIAAFESLRTHPECNGKVGVVGFCFGGWISNMMAVRVPDLLAAVPFYGGQPASEEVHSIKSALLLHFASLDDRVNKGWPDYEEALKENKRDYIAYIYENVNHGFHNDTTPRYDKESASLAWRRTIDFFNEKLK